MKREFVVGLVFFVLLALLLGSTLWIRDPAFLDDTPRTMLDTRFREVSGLRVGDHVRVYGTNAGRVTAIAPDGTGHVIVSMSLEYDPELRENAEVKIVASSALGGSVVAIHPGTPDTPLATADVVEGSSVTGMFGEVNELARQIKEPLLTAIGDIRKVSGDLAARSEEIVANIDEVTRNARDITADLKAGKGTLGKLLQDDTLHTDLTDAIASIRKIAQDADGGGGPLDLLLHDTQVAEDLRVTVANSRSITEKLDGGEGSLGQLLNDPRLYDDLAATAADLRDVAAAARSGQGVLGKLLYDEEVAQRVDDITKDVAQVTRKLRKGEGTLGRLIQDEDLYLELLKSFRALTAGAGDARENAPILTFASFLFGGF